jgi:hypothetical protein
MNGDNGLPNWAEKLAEAISDLIEFKAPANLDAYYSTPDENPWGVDLLEIAPALVEMEDAGPGAGEGYEDEAVFGIYHRIDLLGIQALFDEVAALSLDLDNEGQLEISLEGKLDGQEIILVIYSLPFLVQPDEEDEGEDEEDI